MAINYRKPRAIRPLLIVEAANPEWTSVPLIGWNMSRAIARETCAHMVTHVRNRDAVLRAGLVEGVDFTAIDNEPIAAPMYRLANSLKGGQGVGWTTLMAFSSLAYYSFERALWLKFGQRLANGEFDLVHRITPLSPTSQSLIAKKLQRLGIPFVLGPLNGGVPWPKKFMDRQHAENEWLSHIRGLHKLMPSYYSTRNYASAIFAGSKYTLNEMPQSVKHKCILMSECGIDDSSVSKRRESFGFPLKAIFAGRLVPYKGADMLISAAAPYLASGQLELTIVGDGPERCALEALVGKLGLRDRVRFSGWVSHSDLLVMFDAADLLTFPSIREFGGGVVVEAMARGAVPVVADYAGPSELVDDKTGIRIPFDDATSLINNLRRTLARLIESPATLLSMSAAGQEKVRGELTWQAKANKIVAKYEELCPQNRYKV